MCVVCWRLLYECQNVTTCADAHYCFLQYVTAFFVLLVYGRVLKFLRLYPQIGPTTMSILDVSVSVKLIVVYRISHHTFRNDMRIL